MATIEELEKQLAELKAAAAAPPAVTGLKLDLGCGPNKKEGFFGVDLIKFPGVDLAHDVARHAWPWADNSVDEVHCAHTIEHFEWEGRVFFFNELWRVLKPGGKAQIVVPHWCSHRFYGDPTHKAPISEMAWAYLDKEWRKAQAPHVDSVMAPGPLAYSCDFSHTLGYTMAAWMLGRSTDFQNFAFGAYKEAAQDMMANLVAKK